jgi:pimeloyl-ACP methyl ester carboxylesterase
MGATERKKDVVLFVHGFGSSAQCWKRILELLRSDEGLAQRYEFATWEYPTSWFNLNLLGRIPRLAELGRALGDEVESPRYRGRGLTLVGHSQGGLVIQSYVSQVLQAGEGPKLRGLRQAIFFATPTLGSTTAMSLRILFSTLFSNPQELTLRVLNPDVSDMRAVIDQRVVATTVDSDTAWRIPIHAICGMQDAIVPEASARGGFDSLRTVQGNHFTILKPKDREDDRYREFAELLLEPGGHKQRYEIASYKTAIRVEPRDRQEIAVPSAKNPRTVVFDNYATVKRSVRFQPSNRCLRPFTIRYTTRKEGYVAGHPSCANIAPFSEIGRGEDSGTYFQFDFKPAPEEEFSLIVEVYRGFNEGDRDVHFHLPEARYAQLEYVLDLSAYVAAGWSVKPPMLRFHREDRAHDELCRSRIASEPIAPRSATPEGLWTWELEDVDHGVADIVWDVVAPVHAGASGAPVSRSV